MKQIIVFACFCMLIGCVNRTAERPFHTQLYKRVEDRAHVLTEDDTHKLRIIMDSISLALHVDVFVLTLSELPKGQDIDSYADQFANSIFSDGNSILILTVHSARTSRIEVGMGVENALEDQIAAQYLRDILAPNFKKQKYFDGFSALLYKIRELLIERKKIIGTRPHYIEKWDSIKNHSDK